MTIEFELNAPISLTSMANMSDVERLKTALNWLGYYEVPRYGLTPYPDDFLFRGIKQFQQDKSLQLTGTMSPGCETSIVLGQVYEQAGGPDSLVFVKSHTRQQHGDNVSVRQHYRARPGEGSTTIEVVENGIEPYEITSPVPNPEVRGDDGYGSGHFGASRDHGDHKGVDIVTTPGQVVVSPVSGTFVRKAIPYANDPRYEGVVLKSEDGTEIKMFYIAPTDNLTPGSEVVAGRTPIGTAQDLSKRYPPTQHGEMTNHIHIEAKKDGELLDPSPWYGN